MSNRGKSLRRKGRNISGCFSPEKLFQEGFRGCMIEESGLQKTRKEKTQHKAGFVLKTNLCAIALTKV
ncbi:hypothetical protein ZL54_22465 [Salmonella enterica subsp. enterica]|nr:hypothetical protein [Salmonella enterica subsp. enterica]EEJ7209102.1 hypothetical protein [Salmonella enterica subsp. enterica]